MADQDNIAVQVFTRVHMVPRVNQGQTVALVFELPNSAPPVAFGAPVDVFQKLIGFVPNVLDEAAKIRKEAGLAEDKKFEAWNWIVDSVNNQANPDGTVTLNCMVKGCELNLVLTAEQFMGIKGQRDTEPATKKEAPKKGSTPKVTANPIPAKKTVAQVNKTVAKSPAKKAAPIKKTASKSKSK
jgi:hypothetical protein